MAKKKTPAKPAKKTRVKLTPRDKKTMNALVGMADDVVKAASKKRDPFLDIPSRTLSNVKYSPRKGILEMGNGKNRRQLFDLSQAKAYMRTMLVASGCKRLLDQGKTTSLRGMYYMLKHNDSFIPDEGLAMVRYCTLGDWHTHNEYDMFASEDELDLKKFVAGFDELRRSVLNRPDLEDLSDKDCEQLWEQHYEHLVEKFGLTDNLRW